MFTGQITGKFPEMRPSDPRQSVVWARGVQTFHWHYYFVSNLTWSNQPNTLIDLKQLRISLTPCITS